MKVIDLLNKIANGEEVPEKIKYENYIYWYNKNLKDYENAQVEFESYLISSRYHKTDFLNDEVEIIEEAPEETKVSEEQMLFNNLDSIDRERIIQLMKILQPPKANVVISIDYSSCGE